MSRTLGVERTETLLLGPGFIEEYRTEKDENGNQVQVPHALHANMDYLRTRTQMVPIEFLFALQGLNQGK